MTLIRKGKGKITSPSIYYLPKARKPRSKKATPSRGCRAQPLSAPSEQQAIWAT